MAGLLVVLGEDEILIWASNRGGGVKDGVLDEVVPAQMGITNFT